MAKQIDRSSPLPLYHQLEVILREEIEGGAYGAGDPLPSEGELCERYTVSRSVVRQTLSNLARAGLVRSERGRGTFVAEDKLHERFVQRTRGFYEDLRSVGLPVSTRVIQQAVQPAPPYVREFLEVDTCLRIDRIRSVDDRVLAYVTTYLAPDRVPGLAEQDLTDRSLYAVLEDDYGLRVGSGTRTVEAVGAAEDIALELGVEEGAPLLLLRSASYDGDGAPLEYFEAWHRGDRALFEVDIVAGRRDMDVHGRFRDNGPDLHAQLRASRSVTTPPGGGRPPLGDDGQLVIETLERTKVIAVMRASRYEDAQALVEGLRDGGVALAEFTLTGANALDAIREAADVEGAIVGAGTVLDLPSAEAAVNAGARFLVAPTTSLQIASAAFGVPVFLAGLSPSEVWSAYLATGCPVKVFPASLGGPSLIKDLKGPLPNVPLMPSGGVRFEDIEAYLRAGAVAVNLGGQLCPAEALERGDGELLRANARRVSELLADLEP